MYSCEDRLRAVRLYIKLGKRAGLTSRQLGYPTKKALKAWYSACEQRHDLPRGHVRESQYLPAQRKAAVDHYASHGRCLALTIKVLGYPSRALLARHGCVGWLAPTWRGYACCRSSRCCDEEKV